MSFPLEEDPLLTGLIDDSGSGTNGSVTDKAFFLALAQLITDQVWDGNNPTTTPADLVGEIIEARDAFSRLALRLDYIDDAIAAIVSPDNAPCPNLLLNEDWTIWPEEGAVTAPPAGWIRNGSSLGAAKATWSRSTVNLGSQFSVAIVAGNAAGGLTQQLIAKGTVSPYLGYLTNLFGRSFAATAIVKATTTGVVRIQISDGVNTYSSAYNLTSGATEMLSIAGTLDPAAEKLDFSIVGSAAADWKTGPCTLQLTQVPLTNWIPSETVLHESVLSIDATTLNAECRLLMPRAPSILEQVIVYAKTLAAPTPLKVAIEKWHWDTNTGVDSDRWVNAYSLSLGYFGGTVGGTQLLSSVDAVDLKQRPDGSYPERCFGGNHDYDMVRARVTTIDGAAVEAKVIFRYSTAKRVLERFLPNL